MSFSSRRGTAGFTIVELLIVIVVIGILATVTIVAYGAINKKAIGASLQSDLKNASTQLKFYQVDNGAYPTTNDCSTGATPAPPKICLKSSPGNSYGTSYSANNSANPQTFTLTATHGDIAYVVTHASIPVEIASVSLTCPTGFIVVPGSATYGTSQFCTMKYAASQVGSTTTPISQSGSMPWAMITQTDAISNSPNVAGCTGCHLITEPEFMTIAQNVLGVASNWSGGAVGSGFIYSGHNEEGSRALATDSNDSNSYSGTGYSSPSNQRRTLTLTNGEVIWDLAGNVMQWTSGTVTTGQPGIAGNGYGVREWTAVTTLGSLATNPSPAGTGLIGAGAWNSIKGIGQLQSNADASTMSGFLRGGDYGYAGGSGVLMLNFLNPSLVGFNIGFRVSR